MKYIYLLLVLTTAALTGFIVSVNSIEYQTDSFGSTLTTINATDLIKDSRAVINTNFSTLNTDKMEKSDWYSTTTAPQITTLTNLASIGTITSGTWNGSTLTVAYGGTGSTTLTQGQLLAGNGTGNILTVANGTAGQLLTASTTGNIPYWATPSVDLAATYNWVGLHNFTATTTFTGTTIGSLTNAYIASTTITGKTLPQPVYIASSTSANAGGVLLADANDNDALDFIGFAITNATAGQTVYVQVSGIVSGFTGLTKGADYYVQDAVGTIGTTTGTSEIFVGTAISGTEIIIGKRGNEFVGFVDITAVGSNMSSYTIAVPNSLARTAEIYFGAYDSGGAAYTYTGTFSINKIGKTSTSIYLDNGQGGTSYNVLPITATWSGNSITITNGGIVETYSGDAYFYR